MISVTMLNELNSMIREEAPFLKIVAEKSFIADNTIFDIKLQKTRYVDAENHPLNITNELREDIEGFLNKEGIKIKWNNTTTFWEIK